MYSVPVAVLPERSPIEHSTHAALPLTPIENSVATDAAESVTIEEALDTGQEQLTLPNAIETIILVWLAGIFLFLLWVGSRAVRYNLWLHRRRMPLPSALAQEFQELFAGFKFRKSPRIWLAADIAQPFVWGLFRGSVYLPADFTGLDSPQHHRTVLVHELSHIARFDAAVNLLQILAQAIFWFHPFVWWSNKKIRQEREKCCDEVTIAQFGTPPEHYTGAIVEALATERRSARPIPTLAIVGSVKDIEERIKTMLRPGKKFYKRPSLIAAMAVMLIALLTVPTTLVLTARAAEEVETKSEARPAKPLQQAAAEGDLEQVKLHISSGADVNAKDQRGRAALHRAANTGHVEVVRLLIEHGADVNVGDKLKRTPLEHAAVASRTEVVRLLIQEGANPNARNQNGSTPLHVAAASADKDTVRLLIDSGADVTLRNDVGRTPLHAAMMSANAGRREIVDTIVATGKVPSTIHLAAYMGDLTKVKTFLEEGVAVNEKEADGGTALLYAAAGGRKEAVKLLLARGANVNVQATDGMIPLHAAVFCSDDAETVKLLIANGADVNTRASVEDETGMSVLGLRFARCVMQSLELADREGKNDDLMTARVKELWDSEITQLLMSNGAKVGDGDNMWLSVAAQMGISDIFELAISQSDDVNAKQPGGSTLLHHAARSGQRKLVEQLLSRGASVNAKDGRDATPLHVAANNGHKEIAGLLITRGAKVDAENENGETPLHLAANRGHKEMVEVLIDNGADVNAKNIRRGATPLHTAVAASHKDVVVLLIKSGADVNAKDRQGGTPLDLARRRGNAEIIEILTKASEDQTIVENEPSKEESLADQEEPKPAKSLHQATKDGDIEQVKRLIAEGADTSALDDRDCTPMYYAALYGRKEIVEVFLANGADVNDRDDVGYTLLYPAIWSNDIDTIRIMLENGADVNLVAEGDYPPLYYAVMNNDLDSVELLVAKGAKFNVKTVDGWTVFYHAASMGNREIVKFFFSRGADVSTFHLAACMGDLGRVKSFVEQGADIDEKDEHGWTPLHWAASMGKVETADFLIAKGANIQETTRHGCTVLYQAALSGELKLIELLIAKGADVNSKNRGGDNSRSAGRVAGYAPLHGAAFRGYMDVMELLIDHGADVNAKTDVYAPYNLGWTPLALVCREKNANKDLVEILIAHGADTNIKDRNGRTPLDMAKQRRCTDVVEILTKAAEE
jgi:ankyrin repeat protein/beta-lactamase regulating signal transducer with metallopeptidase domain